MKKIFTLPFLVLGIISVQAQNSPLPPDALGLKVGAPEVLEVKELEFDFGTIPQGKPVYHFFQVTNKGTTALKLDNVQASCGCTTPEWNKEAIAPGATDKIRVGYNAAAEGGFEKFITVTYNGNSTKQIKIKGSVWKAPNGSAPSNASVNYLKQQMQ